MTTRAMRRWLAAGVLVGMLIQTIREEGMDFNHMSMDRISGQQGLWWVSQSYHAMHHVHPNNFFSSFTNGFDVLFGTGAQISGRRFLITGAGGAFGGAMKARLEKLGGIVETAFAQAQHHQQRESGGGPDRRDGMFVAAPYQNAAIAQQENAGQGRGRDHSHTCHHCARKRVRHEQA